MLYGNAVLFALFVWYFSTGLILYLDGLPRWTFRWSMAGATAILAIALHGLALSSADTTPTGAYLAFTYGVLVWAWQEVGFLMGFITGPRRLPSPPGVTPWQHFGNAILAILHHELAIIACAILVVGLTWGGPNQVGMWTFMILWVMRQSAKLNMFLGVPNLNLELLPDHLGFLRGYLTKKPMNLLFPVSITLSTILAVVLVQHASAPGATPFAATAATFLATMTVLALVEHWFMVLPLPFARLWDWGLRSRAPARARRAQLTRDISHAAP